MTSQTLSRVHYFNKQILRVNEFSDEQLYQLALRRRHNVTLHAWGIVSGLDIGQENGGLVVYPGLAIDGYGREVLLAGKQSLATETFDDLATDRLDVWIVYDREDAGNIPSGYGSCVPGATGDAYRANEVPRILFELPLSNTVDARNPPGLPDNVLNAPVPLMSDDPKDTWRVYLGRVIRLAVNQYSIDGSQRTYAGLVGETIDHPANATRVEVGKQSSADVSRVVNGVTYQYQRGEDPVRQESRRFAVFVPEDLPSGSAQQPVSLAPRLEILQDGTIRMRGETVINGSLRIAGGALQFVDPADFTADAAPTVPSIYRFQESGNDELRLDLGSDSVLHKEFVIGFSAADGSFTPCLKLEFTDATGAGQPAPLVTVFGDLKIDGKLTGTFVPPTVSQAALAALLGSFQAGVAAGNAGP
jgi:hypothetical protein